MKKFHIIQSVFIDKKSISLKNFNIEKAKRRYHVNKIVLFLLQNTYID